MLLDEDSNSAYIKIYPNLFFKKNCKIWTIPLEFFASASDIVVAPVWQHAHLRLLSPFPPALVANISCWDILQSPRPKTQLAVWDFQLLTTAECEAEWRHGLLSPMIKRWKTGAWPGPYFRGSVSLSALLLVSLLGFHSAADRWDLPPPVSPLHAACHITAVRLREHKVKHRASCEMRRHF